MIRYILVSILICLAGVFSVSAKQNDEKSRKQMFQELQEFKMNYLSQEMGLNAEQKEKFCKVYDEMTRKRMECMKCARKLERELKKKENPSEADYKAVTEAMGKARAEDAEIEKTYSKKMEGFLTQKQIFKMKEAEESFRQKMEKMRQSHKKKKK